MPTVVAEVSSPLTSSFFGNRKVAFLCVGNLFLFVLVRHRLLPRIRSRRLTRRRRSFSFRLFIFRPFCRGWRPAIVRSLAFSVLGIRPFLGGFLSRRFVVAFHNFSSTGTKNNALEFRAQRQP